MIMIFLNMILIAKQNDPLTGLRHLILWVIFNSRLSFDAHINDKVSKTNKTLGLISPTNAILNEVALVQLHKEFVRPHLDFSNCVWSPSLKNYIVVIENVPGQLS